jgi:hypothetical protein
MKTNKIFFFFCLMMVCTYSEYYSQTWQWAKRTGSNGDNAPFSTGNQDEKITDLKVDEAGNIFAVGLFFANPIFNNSGAFGQTTPPGFGQADAYLIKYSSCGKTLWWRRNGQHQLG